MSKNKIESLSGLVIVTGASSGIGLELAKLAARDGCELILVADRDLSAGAQAARSAGAASVETLKADLSTREGIQQLMRRIEDREVAALFANAGHGQGDAFLDQDWGEIAHVIHTNVTGTVALIHMVGKKMRAANKGRILVTGSVAGHIPGAFQLVYNSTKSFMDFFCVGLANELKETDVTITCLLPGPTDTEFFDRADLEDTQVGQDDDKADPAKVAKDGYEAMLDGDTQVVSGWVNKLQVMFADILPDAMVAQMHRKMAQPNDEKETEQA